MQLKHLLLRHIYNLSLQNLCATLLVDPLCVRGYWRMHPPLYCAVPYVVACVDVSRMVLFSGIQDKIDTQVKVWVYSTFSLSLTVSEKSQKKLLVLTKIAVSGTQSNALSEYHAIQRLCKFVIVWLSPKLCSAAAHAVAYPGFSLGGALTPKVGVLTYFLSKTTAPPPPRPPPPLLDQPITCLTYTTTVLLLFFATFVFCCHFFVELNPAPN